MKKIFIMVLLSLTVISCSKVMLPYAENPVCRKGVDSGLCGSVPDVYNHLVLEDEI